MKLPVRILVDRAGIVGDDGETHHGVFDMALLRSIPDMTILAPSNGEELRDMIHFAASYNDGPVVIRYPRGRTASSAIDYDRPGEKIVPGKAKRLSQGKDCAIFAVGDMVKIAMEARDILKKSKKDVTVVNLRSLKPLDIKLITRIVEETRHFVTLENGVVSGGIGEAVSAALSPECAGRLLFHAGFPDSFVPQGSNAELFRDYALDALSIASRIEKSLAKKGRGKKG